MVKKNVDPAGAFILETALLWCGLTGATGKEETDRIKT